MIAVKYAFDIIMIWGAIFLLLYGCVEIRKNKMWLLYIVFFFLFCFPVLLNYFLKANYASGYWYGYSVIQDDILTSVLYDVVMLIILVAFYFLLEHYKPDTIEEDESKSFFKKRIVVIALYVLTIAPAVLFFLFSPIGKYSPFIIFKFGWRYTYEQKSLDYFGYGAVERLTYISTVASVLLISGIDFKKEFFTKGNSARSIVVSALKLIFILLGLGLAILIQGKRSAFLFATIVLAIAFVYKYMKKTKIWISGIILAIVIGAAVFACIYFAEKYRTSGKTTGVLAYTALRVDLFRDQSLKFAIYSAIHSKEIRIVSFPGQSYLTELFYLFPLVYLPISFKRGYETYLTANEMLAPYTYLNKMRLTNSGIDELVANFSFFGVFIFIFMLWALIRRMAKSSNDTRIVLTVGFVLFLMYTTSYICWYFEILLAAYIFDRFIKYLKNRKAAHEQEA